MVIYSGPSKIDGKPIVAIITGLGAKSHNPKTGAMPQVWIIRSDIHPTEALRTGEDVSVCGNCPHRPTELGDGAMKKHSRSCYVNAMGFNQVFKKYRDGGYEVADISHLAHALSGKKVRLGAYGDPAAVPIAVWRELLTYCESTGYTHQWRTCDKEYSQYCMASCDTPIEVTIATDLGYRTFFVQDAQKQEPVKTVGLVKLAHCPASKEMGKATTCMQCMACSGTRTGRKSNVTIFMH